MAAARAVAPPVSDAATPTEGDNSVKRDLWGSNIRFGCLKCVLCELEPCAAVMLVAMSTSLLYVLLRQVLQMLTQIACDGGVGGSRTSGAALILQRHLASALGVARV
ncbi:hypothetical protein ACIBTZ_32990 [Micromonospora sp. NPDC049460]|uniref:hypothetical protein n=1 Tax=unclassified Micromonospora TaxID=2617518 RepID=UPI003716212A